MGGAFSRTETVSEEGTVAPVEQALVDLRSGRTQISLTSAHFTRPQMHALAACIREHPGSLRSVQLFTGRMTEEDSPWFEDVCEALSRCPSLRSLALMGFGDESSRRTELLAGLLTTESCAITALDVTFNSLDAAGCRLVAQALAPPSSRVSSLVLARNEIGREGGDILGELLRSNRTLTLLSLADMVRMEAPGVAAVVAALPADNRTLRVLDLSCNDLSPEAVESISATLAANPVLSSLSLRGCGLRPADAASLARGLAANGSLRELDLSSAVQDGASVEALAGALATCSLKVLDLSGNQIGDAPAAALAGALGASRSLEELRLGRNTIGVVGMRALAGLLAPSAACPLRSLSLEENRCLSEGMLAVAQALEGNTSLATLVLDFNSVGDEGGVALAAALRVNSTLTMLSLWSTNVREAGAVALAEALAVNTGLRTLVLRNCRPGDRGSLGLAHALSVNRGLTSLDLSCTAIDYIRPYALALRENRFLVRLNLKGNPFALTGESWSEVTSFLDSNLSVQLSCHKSVDDTALFQRNAIIWKLAGRQAAAVLAASGAAERLEAPADDWFGRALLRCCFESVAHNAGLWWG